MKYKHSEKRFDEDLGYLDSASSSPNSSPECLVRGGMKLMTSIIGDLKSNAKFGIYSTGDGEDVLTVTLVNNTAVTA